MTHTGPADRNRRTLTFHLKLAIDEACSEVMNRLAPSCRPLYWSASSGDPYYGMSGLASEGHYTTEAAASLVREWAEKFDLQPDLTAQPGTHRYHGDIHGLPVEVWSVIDRDAFETDER